MSYVIEKNVPIPADGNALTGIRSTLRQMAVGDSFLLPSDNPSFRKITASISNFRHTAPDNRAKKFSVRKVEGGKRVWRVA